MIFQENEQKTEHYDERAGLEMITKLDKILVELSCLDLILSQEKRDSDQFYLMMELEEGIVYCEFVTLEPLEEAADQGESVDDGGGRHLEG